MCIHKERIPFTQRSLYTHTHRVYNTRVVLELIASLRNEINYQCKLSAVNDVFVTHNKAIYILLLVRHFIEYHFFLLLLLRLCGCCGSRCLFVCFRTLRSLRHSTRVNATEQSVTSRAAKEATTTKAHEQRQRQAGDNQKLTQNCSITVNCLT